MIGPPRRPTPAARPAARSAPSAGCATTSSAAWRSTRAHGRRRRAPRSSAWCCWPLGPRRGALGRHHPEPAAVPRRALPAVEVWRVWAAAPRRSRWSWRASAGSWRTGRCACWRSWLAAGQGAIAVLCGGLRDGPRWRPVALVANAALLIVVMAAGAAGTRSRRRLLHLGWLARGAAHDPAAGRHARARSCRAWPATVWGGLLLTLLLAAVEHRALVPARRRARPRAAQPACPSCGILSTAFIEIVRGVPLVTIIFLADIMLPALPAAGTSASTAWPAPSAASPSSRRPTSPRTCGAASRPSPAGQVEAAQAIGLRSWQTNRLIVLPQALRMVIPANVGLFISLLKDTTLVVIVVAARDPRHRPRRARPAGVAGHIVRGLRLRRRRVLRPLLRPLAGELSSRAGAGRG